MAADLSTDEENPPSLFSDEDGLKEAESSDLERRAILHGWSIPDHKRQKIMEKLTEIVLDDSKTTERRISATNALIRAEGLELAKRQAVLGIDDDHKDGVPPIVITPEVYDVIQKKMRRIHNQR
jgi:hypothetical protein